MEQLKFGAAVWDDELAANVDVLVEVNRTCTDEIRLELTRVDGEQPVTVFLSLAAAAQLEQQVNRQRRKRWEA